MGTQLSAVARVHAPGLAGWMPTVRRRVGAFETDRRTNGPDRAGVVLPPAGTTGQPCGAGSRSPGSNAGASRGLRGGRSAVPRTVRRGRPVDRRRPRSGHLPGSGRRLVAPPVECPRGVIRGRSWERWARLGMTLTVATLLGMGIHSALVPPRAGVLVPVTVTRGDTLWGLARDHAPDRDPRAVVDEIVRVNDLPEGVLPVGIVIRVPISSPVQEAATVADSPTVTVG